MSNGAAETSSPAERRFAPGRTSGPIVPLSDRKLNVVVIVLVAAKIILLFILAWNTRYVMDEFVQLGWAKFLNDQLFVTNWPVKAVGFAVFYKFAHLIGWDAQSILLIGRLQTALLACATIAIVYACARALGHDRLRSLVVVLVLLSFSNFMERIFRTIAEPLAVFFAAASLLVVLRGKADRAGTVVLAGMLTGLAFLTTQKSIWFNVALGIALVGDAMLARRFVAGFVRGALLVAGWLISVAAYCIIFGGSDPLAVATKHLFFAPVANAMHGADPYGSLRFYVLQTVERNAILYAFCFAGMALSLLRIMRLDQPRRVALIFTMVITGLVFSHNQPWPYIFIMALPFIALWSTEIFDVVRARRLHLVTAAVAMGIAVATSFAANVLYLGHDNRSQLQLVGRAEGLLKPDEPYFDGVGMLPNRREASGVWLDQAAVFQTLREGPNSDAYRMFAQSPPKIIIWTYRMDAIDPLVDPLIRDSYVKIAPNLRIEGCRLHLAKQVVFDVPIAGRYGLYGVTGMPLQARVEINGAAFHPGSYLAAGPQTVTLRNGPDEALLLPEGSYAQMFDRSGDYGQLFADVYN